MAQSKAGAEPKTRLSKKEIRQQKRARQQTWNRLLWSIAGIVVIALLGYIIWSLVRPRLGQSIPQQARTHIQASDPHEPYNSDPPTSGAHAGTVQADFYEEAPPDENLVHNLEHGYIILWYNCSQLDEAQCQTLKAQIQGMMDRARPVTIATGTKKLIAAPRPTMDSMLTLTSWGHLYKLNSFEEADIMQFINDFRNQAPEPGAP